MGLGLEYDRVRASFQCQWITYSWLPAGNPWGSAAGCRQVTQNAFNISRHAQNISVWQSLVNYDKWEMVSEIVVSWRTRRAFRRGCDAAAPSGGTSGCAEQWRAFSHIRRSSFEPPTSSAAGELGPSPISACRLQTHHFLRAIRQWSRDQPV